MATNPGFIFLERRGRGKPSWDELVAKFSIFSSQGARKGRTKKIEKSSNGDSGKKKKRKPVGNQKRKPGYVQDDITHGGKTRTPG